MNYTNSPIQKITFNNQKYFVKRDDLLNSDFSGNKARKFYYYLINDFPKIKKVVSFGFCSIKCNVFIIGIMQNKRIKI
jgi:1-aminocyclopropane-1-carboxylate deaminase